MALNFPNNPAAGATYTSAGVTWEFDGVVWNLVYTTESGINQFTTFAADTGTASASTDQDTLTINGGTNVTTSISGKVLTIDATVESQAGAADVFKNIVSDDGQATASGDDDTLNILGGTHISTVVATDTKNVQINLDPFSINFLTDVDTVTNSPSSGQVLKWDGAKWAPGLDATSGGTGLDADTLDGQDGSYYLNYNNFTNTPSVATLTSFSVGNELTASGDGAISYNNTTGVFRYTPPTAAGIGALTTEVNDLTAAVVWANVPDANITQSSVVQHQAALTITESQISNLQNYLTGIGSLSINALSDVDTVTSAPSNGQVLAWDSGNGVWVPSAVGGSGEVNQNAFSNVAVSGQTTVAADTSTDTLTLAAGSGISITTDAGTDTITITNTVSSGATAFTGLSDASTASLTIDKIYEPAIAMLRVDNSGTSSYNFLSHYSGENPTIYVLAGTTIAFDLDGIPGHPFEIQNPQGDPYNVGLVHVSTNGIVSTGAAAQGKSSGTLYWRIPESISGGYRYQCQSHAPMVGAITVKRLSII
jgi:plastocyanin